MLANEDADAYTGKVEAVQETLYVCLDVFAFTGTLVFEDALRYRCDDGVVALPGSDGEAEE